MATKPIRVFYSPLSDRFYATRHYRVKDGGVVVVTGQKDDVTQDVAHAIVTHGVTFKEVEDATD